MYQFKTRPNLPEGCPEKMDMTFLRWIWDYPRNSRPRDVAAMQQAGPDVQVVTITRRAQARTILNAVSPSAA